jgi:hypothetical protein
VSMTVPPGPAEVGLPAVPASHGSCAAARPFDPVNQLLEVWPSDQASAAIAYGEPASDPRPCGPKIRRDCIPRPIVCAGQTFGWAHASRSSPQFCARIARAETLDTRLCRSAACAFWMNGRLKLPPLHTPTRYPESRPPAFPLVRGPFALGGRCRIRICVGVHRRIYRQRSLKARPAS